MEALLSIGYVIGGLMLFISLFAVPWCLFSYLKFCGQLDEKDTTTEDFEQANFDKVQSKWGDRL